MSSTVVRSSVPFLCLSVLVVADTRTRRLDSRSLVTSSRVRPGSWRHTAPTGTTYWPLDLHPPCCCDVSAGAIGQLPHIGRQQPPCSFASAHDAVMQCKACKTSAAHAVRPWHGMPGRRARDSNNGDDVEMMRWWLPESLAARAFLVLKFFFI
jgi:hypothetical protein